MPRMLIVYATTDGHTRKVAEAFARSVRQEGYEADVVLASKSGKAHAPERYDRVAVAASVHAGGYQSSVLGWARDHQPALASRPTAFLSVCLGVLQDDPKVRRDLERIEGELTERTQWRPARVLRVAGALPYTRYGFIKKWVMKRIAAKAGGGTDTSRDYEYTDWEGLASFARGFAAGAEAARPA